jgi:hypothetical protein
MIGKELYLIDADVFIQAKNQHYAFPICPGFWDSLVGHFHAGHVFSIEEIREELLRGDDEEDLVRWVKGVLPRQFFLPAREHDVSTRFGEIMLWVQRNSQFMDYAKAKFATEADGWLAAYAKVHGFVVVTGEQFRPDAKNKVPLPNVCRQFGVECRDVFRMLRDLGVRFEWNG